MNTLIDDFIGEIDKKRGKSMGSHKITSNINLTGVQNTSTTILQEENEVENRYAKLSVIKVSGIEGKSSIFTFIPTSKKGKKIIKDTKKDYDRVFYIPCDEDTIVYSEGQLNYGNNSIDSIIERFGQVIAGNIILRDLEKLNDNYEGNFESIRRKLQKEKNIQEMEAYIYMYKVISPYVGISTFLSLIDANGKKPTSFEYFSTIHGGIILENLNKAINELDLSKTIMDELFLIRDSVLTACSNENIKGLVYPFSK